MARGGGWRVADGRVGRGSGGRGLCWVCYLLSQHQEIWSTGRGLWWERRFCHGEEFRKFPITYPPRELRLEISSCPPPRRYIQRITKMQLFYAVLCLGVLATSALRSCEDYCPHPGNCFKKMKEKGLVCDSGTQQRAACDHHGLSDTATNEQIKKECCPVTCFSLYEAKKFTCLSGLNPPTKDKMETVNPPDKKISDVQAQCCKKPKVSCYTLLKDGKFTCPATHFSPTKNYMNHDFWEDMSKKTTDELINRCCKQKSVCHARLIKKNLDCEGFGVPPGKRRVSGLTCRFTFLYTSDA